MKKIKRQNKIYKKIIIIINKDNGNKRVNINKNKIYFRNS